ncbi:MAG: helix-turn-helix domain-containing protein [Xanthobacteraceae bacterium]|jgi:IclR helix-turn-helix domain
MKPRHRHQDAVLVIADMMWALRRLGASIFFPEYKLPQAHRFILVGAALGYAQLRGRPLTLASLSRNIEMPRATAARILEELKLSGWVQKRGNYYILDFSRLEEPGYAEYFEEAARRIAIAKKKLSELDISG